MLRNWAFTRKTILRSASKDVSVASKDNIFKIRRPVRDSPFSGAIFQTLMQDLDVEFNDPNKVGPVNNCIRVVFQSNITIQYFSNITILYCV